MCSGRYPRLHSVGEGAYPYPQPAPAGPGTRIRTRLTETCQGEIQRPHCTGKMENYNQKISVRENTGNLETLSKHRENTGNFISSSCKFSDHKDTRNCDICSLAYEIVVNF